MNRINILLLVLLAIFIILAIVFIFLYFSSLVYLINPKEFPQSSALYGVIQNQAGSVLNNCIGIGADPLSSECRFQADTLYNAINICSDNNCSAFQYNDVTGESFFVSTPLVQGPLGSIVYVSQTQNGSAL